ncbi:hypothetical protein Tco_0257662 [Tanacetum coccineum]
MFEALEHPFCLLEFRGFSSFDGWKLVDVGNGIKSVRLFSLLDHYPKKSSLTERGPMTDGPDALGIRWRISEVAEGCEWWLFIKDDYIEPLWDSSREQASRCQGFESNGIWEGRDEKVKSVGALQTPSQGNMNRILSKVLESKSVISTF